MRAQKLFKKLDSPPYSLISNVSLTIPTFLGDKNQKILAVCDSGAQISVIGENTLNTVYSDWKQQLVSVAGPKNGISANNEIFPFLDTKLIPITIAGLTKTIEFAVIKNSPEPLLGINCLNAFDTQITFENNHVIININDHKFDYNLKQNYVAHIDTNNSSIILEKGVTKTVKHKLNIEIKGLVYIIPSANSCTSLIPAVYDIQDNTVDLLYKNTSSKVIHLEPHTQKYEIVQISETDLTNPSNLTDLNLFEYPPIKFFSKNITSNHEFFQNEFRVDKIHVSKISTPMNEVYTDDLIYNDKDKGVGIPPSYDIDPMEIVREYLPKNLDDHS